MYVFTCCKYTNNIYEVIAESVGPLEILGPWPKISCGLSHQIELWIEVISLEILVYGIEEKEKMRKLLYTCLQITDQMIWEK